MIARHHYADGCDCSICLRHFRQHTLWLGSIFTVLAAVATVHVGAWLYQLITGSAQ